MKYRGLMLPESTSWALNCLRVQPMLDETTIPSNRVSITDSRTGLIDRSWYRYFLSLYNNVSGTYPLNQPDPVVVGASPFQYINTTNNTYDLIVSGGGISKMEFIR